MFEELFLHGFHKVVINSLCDMLEDTLIRNYEAEILLYRNLEQLKSTFNPQVIVVRESLGTIVKKIREIIEITDQLREIPLVKTEEDKEKVKGLIEKIQRVKDDLEREEKFAGDAIGDKERFIYILQAELQKKEKEGVGN